MSALHDKRLSAPMIGEGGQGVSIIISVYNFERYVAQAIDSALDQCHDPVQVIVVDDASTDGSADAIAAFGARVEALFLAENHGQIGALMAGLAKARHPIVMFLDADDRLLPHAASVVAGQWHDGIARIQFPLLSIDKVGDSLQHVAPKFPKGLTTERIRALLLQSGQYPSVQTSGNAYSTAMARACPTEPPLHAIDTLLELNAPFHGDVVTLGEPLGEYRMHDGNFTQQGQTDAPRFRKVIETFDARLAYLDRLCQERKLAFSIANAARRAPARLEAEIALARLEPSKAARSVWSILGDAIRTSLVWPANLSTRAVRLLWFVAMALAPMRITHVLIRQRFVVAHRPRWFETLIGNSPPRQADISTHQP